MPDNMNPYMDSGMNPNGYIPGYGQPGYVDETNPYAVGWDQAQYGMPQQGYPGMPQQGMMPEEYMNPGAMASPQDIYANQAAQMGGMPGQYGAPYADPNMPYVDPGYGMAPQPYVDPYGQPVYPMGQPQADPMHQVPMPGQTGQQAPVSPSQTGGFDNPMLASQGVAEPQVPAAQAAAAAADAQAKQQAAQHLQQVQAAQQQIKQQAAQQQAAQQTSQQQAAKQQPQPQQASKKQKRQQAQMQPMPTVGIPVVNPRKATKGRATMALILSILSIILALVPPVGLILAIIARKTAKSYKKNGGRAGSGDAAAVFSLVGIIFSVIMCGLLIWFIGYVNGALIGSKAYMNPISFFNNSPLGNIFKIPTS